MAKGSGVVKASDGRHRFFRTFHGATHTKSLVGLTLVPQCLPPFSFPLLRPLSGIGRTLASREATSPECRQLVAEFVSDERDEMYALFYRSLRAIEQALSARREYMTKEG